MFIEFKNQGDIERPTLRRLAQFLVSISPAELDLPK
jgi:hypothetical protein